MKIIRFDDANRYYQKVVNYLLQHEAVHCLLLGIAKSLGIAAGENDVNLPCLAVVEDKQNVLATAVRTPRRKLVLSKTSSDRAIELVARNFASNSQSLPGVIAPKSEAETFVNIWRGLTGQSYELDFAMRVHQLQSIQPFTSAAGSLRLAEESDRSLLIAWGQAFEEEALGDKEPKSDHQFWFNRHLKNKSLFVWQNREVVSMAAYSGATPNGIRINAVYTPPEHRGQGYATSCVAKLSQQLLERYKYCFLFTNLANPTSNHIYHKIGFTLMGDINNYGFTDPKSSS